MAERGKGRGRPQMFSLSEKKRRKVEYDKQRKGRVAIGDNIDRWNAVKSENDLSTHADMAKFLLDRYAKENVTQETLSPTRPETEASTSTPMPVQQRLNPTIFETEFSEISEGEKSSAQESIYGIHISGIKEIRDDPVPPTSIGYTTRESISIEVSEAELAENTECADEDYEPSFNVAIGPTECELDSVHIGDIEFDELDNDAQEYEEEKDMEYEPGITRILSQEDCSKLTTDSACLAYVQPLLVLARTRVSNTCQVKGCKKEVSISQKFIGSALYLKWACPSGHQAYRWCSQPVLSKGLHGGDILSAAALLASGNNYAKVALFAKFLKLHFLSSTSFDRLQAAYLVPQIDAFWKKKQDDVLAEFKDKELVILGDGRMDSPGHSAQYCSYTIMENDSKKILSVVTLDKREADKKSTNLELLAFNRTMQTMKEKNMNVVEVVTDAHLQIGALMKKDYKAVKHSHDIWHAAKNLGKKIISAGQDKECRQLQKWSKHIVNHFWHVCQKASTKDEFTGMWCSLLHHVVDEHEWVLPYCTPGTYKCDHGPLEDDAEKEWLVRDGPAHSALRKIIKDCFSLFAQHWCVQCNCSWKKLCAARSAAQSTAELENFQQHILMYAAKRFAYSPPVYQARNQLAALDYNANVERPFKENEDGSVRYRRMFNKKSGRWTVVAEKVKKSYDHVMELLQNIVKARVLDKESISKKRELARDDPRRISATIAPILPPPTSTLIEEKKSRLK